ncbi:fatty acid desaturase [Cystobacter fuscus]|uniref:Fatty acid desaturase n=1 Tax=Cystobacter fuscus TaxID=43 RepID=A0A250J677_9BACT|nr:fatty acid desaturase [Cystobacter fuscus]
MKIWKHSRRDAVLLALSLAQAATMFALAAAWDESSWLCRLGGACLLVLTVTYNFIVISHLFMHEPWFESRRLNALASALNSFIIGQSLQRHQLFHVRNHHRYNNDRKDADGKTKDLTSTFQQGEGGEHGGLFHYVFRGAVSMLGTTGRGLLSVTRLWRVGEHERELLELVAKGPARREQELRQVRLDRLAHFAGVCVFLALSWRWTLCCYLPALFLALVLVNLQNYFEHFGAAPESRYTDSVSYYGRLYNLLAFNDGYHQEHHLRPQAHWSLLPEVRHELTAQLEGAERVISPVPALLGFLHRDRPLLHRRPGGRSIPGSPRAVLILLMSVFMGADTALASIPSEARAPLDTCLERWVELSGGERPGHLRGSLQGRPPWRPPGGVARGRSPRRGGRAAAPPSPRRRHARRACPPR